APAEPYKCGVRAPKLKDMPKTSAKPAAKNKQENLTLSDWLQVFSFVDRHPSMTQKEIVAHFKTLASSALVFSQETLSRKLNPAKRQELEDRVASNPTVLSSKRECVIRWPDVKRAVILWVHTMEDKGETVTRDMLMEKYRWFEDAFDVPEAERLKN
ncbi:hypothetical protein B0H10DRAFT_1765294, partial [Mycena sp. CBHHK59/15]